MAEPRNNLNAVVITQRRRGNNVTVRAATPNDVSIQFKSDWSSPFSDVGSLGGAYDQAARTITGGTLGDKRMTALVWKGTAPPSIPLTLEFHAESDAVKDVVEPVVALIQMVLPEQLATGVIQAPGPSIGGQLLNTIVDKIFSRSGGSASDLGEVITLEIGTRFIWPLVVLNSVQVTMPTLFNDEGYPIRMVANISISPFITPYREDIPQMFGLNPPGK